MDKTPNYKCKLCGDPIRKVHGDEEKPEPLACWIHLDGRYQCFGSRSEYDLATYDAGEAVSGSRR